MLEPDWDPRSTAVRALHRKLSVDLPEHEVTIDVRNGDQQFVRIQSKSSMFSTRVVLVWETDTFAICAVHHGMRIYRVGNYSATIPGSMNDVVAGVHHTLKDLKHGNIR